MQDIEFINAIEGVLDEIEARCEGSGADIVVERSGNVLNLEFDNGSRIVVNSQVAMHELWIAARSGGFHLKLEGDDWHDSRSGAELYQLLSRLASEHAEESVDLTLASATKRSA
jgi:CyaY protein